MDRGPSKTIQLQLGAGNTLGRTWVRGLLSAKPWFLVPGSPAWARWFRNLGLVLKYLNGECFVICGFYKYTLLASTEFNLTVPASGLPLTGRARAPGNRARPAVGFGD